MPIPTSMDATWLNLTASYNAQELRQADSAMFNGDATAFGVRGGVVRHGDTSLVVTVDVADLVTIQPGAAVIPGNSGTGNGCYRAALGAATTGTLAARNATNPRITLVIFRALDTDVIGTHGAYTGRIEFVDGAPAASPVAPALPLLAIELARITVPATGGGAATVDSTNRQYAAGIGGRLAVSSFAKLPATDSKYDKAVALDTGVEYEWNGTAWVKKASIDIIDWATLSGSYAANWSDFAGYQAGQFRKVGDVVELRGLLLRSTSTYTVSAAILQLPVGFRPPVKILGPSMCSFGATDSPARYDIDSAGVLTCNVAVQAANYLSLQGIRFSTI